MARLQKEGSSHRDTDSISQERLEYMLSAANRVHSIDEVRRRVIVSDSTLAAQIEERAFMADHTAKLVRRKLQHGRPLILENSPAGLVVGVFPETPHPERKISVVVFDRFSHKQRNVQFEHPAISTSFHAGSNHDSMWEFSLTVEEKGVYASPAQSKRKKKIVAIDSQNPHGPKDFFVFSKFVNSKGEEVDEVVFGRVDRNNNLSPYEYYRGGTGWVISGVGMAPK